MLAFAESDGAGALEAPTAVGDGLVEEWKRRLSEVALEIADGGEGVENDLAVFLVGVLLLGTEDVNFAGDSVAISI